VNPERVIQIQGVPQWRTDAVLWGDRQHREGKVGEEELRHKKLKSQ
jgi:hypothetical protein